MIGATVAAGGRGQLLAMTRLTLRLEMGLGGTMEQHGVTSSSLPPALRARQGNNRCSRGRLRTQEAFLRRLPPPASYGSFLQTHNFSSSSTARRSKARQSSETQGDKVTISPALLLHLQNRLEKWHLASSGRSSSNSRVYDMSAEERQEHLDLAQMELKWMMDQVYASDSASVSTSTSQGQIRSQEDELSLRRALGGHLKDMMRRRVVDHEPLAYILGSQPFGSLDLVTRPPTLIPRSETEDWTSRLIGEIQSALSLQSHADEDCVPSQRPLRILDLCTGTGCIGLYLAATLQDEAQLTCADVAEEALQLVRENLLRNNIVEQSAHDETSAGVRLARVDLFSPRSQLARDLLEERDKSGSGTGYDILVCNPPYIPRAEYEALQPSVRLWEDQRALLGEYDGSSDKRVRGKKGVKAGQEHGREDGLTFYRRLADVLDMLLHAPSTPAHPTPLTGPDHKGEDVHSSRLPVLALEVGKGQAAAVEEIFRASISGQRMDFERWEDPWGVERAVVGYWRLE